MGRESSSCPFSIDLHVHGLARAVAHDGLADGGLLADEALERVLPQRRHEADRLLLIVVRDIDDHLVEQAHHIAGRVVGDDLRRVHHPLQIADAAVVAVFLALGGLVLEVLAQVAEAARHLDFLDQLRPQLKRAVVDLVFHLLNVDFRQFIIHEKHLDFSGVHLITFRVGRKGFAVVFHELPAKDRAEHAARGRPRGKDLPQQRPRQVAVERGEKAREKLRRPPPVFLSAASCRPPFLMCGRFAPGKQKKRTASGVRMLHALRSCCVSATRASPFLADSGRKVKRRLMIFRRPGTLAHIERSGSDWRCFCSRSSWATARSRS